MPQQIMMAAVVALTPGSCLTTAVCAALEVSRASVHRHRRALTNPQRAEKQRPPVVRALPERERDQVLAHLSTPRFSDQTPAGIYATLPGEGVYLCSIRTMYLDPCRSGRGRRTPPPASSPGLSEARTAGRGAQSGLVLGHQQVDGAGEMVLLLSLRHPRHRSPPAPGPCIPQNSPPDCFVRASPDRSARVGWRVEHAESAIQFKALFQDAMAKHAVPPDQLTLHADRGAPMKAKATALMLADLGVVKSHSRPHTSNDNPFSEAHFKTLKYQPEFPKRFQTIDEARAFCRRFFAWYNEDHHHAGIGLMTPDRIRPSYA